MVAAVKWDTADLAMLPSSCNNISCSSKEIPGVNST